MASIPIITIDAELVGADAMEAVSKAFADLIAKKSFVVLPKGVNVSYARNEQPSEEQVPDPPVQPVQGARRIDLDD